jgi:hypothetical protein
MWHNLPSGWATPWFRYGVAHPSSRTGHVVRKRSPSRQVERAPVVRKKEPGSGTQGG